MRFPQGHCQRCGKVDDRTATGLTNCAVCAAKCNERAMNYYNRRISEKRCVTCGIQDDRTLRGRRQCELCAKFAVEKKRIKKEAAGNATSQAAKTNKRTCIIKDNIDNVKGVKE